MKNMKREAETYRKEKQNRGRQKQSTTLNKKAYPSAEISAIF
jgi:hypothetical protein